MKNELKDIFLFREEFGRSYTYVDNPKRLTHTAPSKIERIASKEGLTVKTLGRGGQEGNGMRVNFNGDRLLQYHPGSGHHPELGGDYWKVSSGSNGTARYPYLGSRFPWER